MKSSVSMARLVAFCLPMYFAAAVRGSLALLAAFLLLSQPRGAVAATAADCQQMQNLAQQNMNLYNQHRDPAHLQAARTYESHARQCWASLSGSGGGGGGGGYSGGGGGGNRFQQGMGALQRGLGILRDMSRQQEQKQRQENNRLGREAEQEGLEHYNSGRYEEALYAFQRGYQYFQQNGEGGNMAVMENHIRDARERLQMREQARLEAEELEKKRRAAAEKAADDKKRQAMINPWAPAGAGAGGTAPNPFGSTISSPAGGSGNPSARGGRTVSPDNPFVDGSASAGAPSPDNPFARPPQDRNPGQIGDPKSCIDVTHIRDANYKLQNRCPFSINYVFSGRNFQSPVEYDMGRLGKAPDSSSGIYSYHGHKPEIVWACAEGASGCNTTTAIAVRQRYNNQ
ncbi:MAG: hypothetical protein HYY65_00535 [Candidatus Tectomicrobia bacterium]|uniref:Tetratricopeptide repeat protein n=1 Tax=Tectimicrobiota bacterium TaxID=2528274 RepID=A0A932GMA5_UNCTE|nr:hypothetical protein [Candidatus Tectomicrobia bacterium]